MLEVKGYEAAFGGQNAEDSLDLVGVELLVKLVVLRIAIIPERSLAGIGFMDA